MKTVSQFKTKGILRNRHLQTILTQYLSKKVNYNTQREIFELSDGDFLELYLSGNMENGIVIILHGILGDLNSHYSVFSFEIAHELGLGAIFINARGAPTMENRTPRFFNAGDTRDLHEVIQHIKTSFPGVPLFALGYSLGGGILTKWLAENNINNPLKAAMVASIPFDLKHCTESFQKYPGKFYSNYMVRNICKMLHQRYHKYYNDVVDLKKLKKVRTFPELDNLVTAPINGYLDANDYYKKGSPRYYLKAINTPLLIIHALDDPFIPPHLIPNDEDLSENVTLEVSENGGHLGFIAEVRRWKADYWIKRRVKNFLMEHL